MNNFFKFSILALTILLSNVIYAQPANDNCSGATNMGTLPTPGACVSGLQNGAPITLNNQTTVGATASDPYPYMNNCTGGGNMTSLALDTWYSFTASGTIVNVAITGFPNASVGVWTGTCGNLSGRGCLTTNGGGSGTLVITQAQPGQVYYVQISGNNGTATDNNFSIAVDNDIDCDDCLRASNLTSNPQPVNGTYLPGQVVNFCYTVTSWSEMNTNWFHGVQITMGSGWTGTITNTVPSPECGYDPTPGPGNAGAGQWAFYNSVTSSATGASFGQGFYFDNSNVAGTNPGQNYGDPTNGNCTWTFCWSLTVKPGCTPAADLSVTVNTTGDGESGSWPSVACSSDDATNFNAQMVCCSQPLTTVTPTTCQGGSDGSATAQGQGGVSPYDYVWRNSGGTIVSTQNNLAGVSTLSGMPAGTYTCTVTDDLGCQRVVTVVITDGPSCTCLITNMTANIGACEPTNTFTVDGTFQYSNSPGGGTAVVEVTNSSGTYTQVFNPPFVNGTTYNYNISGVPSDGSALTVTVYFTNDITCTQTINSTSPASCGCAAEIGTFTSSTDGNQSGNNFTLCFGDFIDVSANGDYTPPAEATSPPLASGYDPGISWLVYSCPPTMALVPSTTESIPDDPCLITIASNINLNEVNDQWWINAYPGTFTNNTVYFVPITMYNMTSGTYSYVNTTMPCYELGQTYAVQFLPDITMTSSQNCVAGTVTATVSGGLPAVNGSNFTASNLLPATASFSNTTAANGGTITVSGLVDGDNYSFDIQDANGCPVTVTGTFVGIQNAGFTYPQNAYCQSAPNPSPTITGVAGGTFSSTGGLSINPASGVINLAASTPATYTVTYTTPDPVCFGTATFNITINPLPTVGGNNATICQGASVTLNGTGANTYTWNNGVTNGVAFTPASTTTYTVTGTVTATGCQNSGSATVTVNPLDNASFTASNYCVGAANSATVSGTPGGTFSFNPAPGDGATINAASGSISNGVGGNTYTIQYTTGGACPASSTQNVTVNALPIVDVPDVSVCTGGSVNLTATGATSFNWSPATFLNQTNGATVSSTPSSDITYTITGTDANGCQNNDAAAVTIMANAPINAGPDVSICQGQSLTITASGGVSYTWDNGLGAGASHTITPLMNTTYIVNGQDAVGCTGTDQVVVSVYANPSVNAGTDQTICEGTPVTLSGSGASTYVWDNGVTNGALFTPAVGNVTYTVVGTDANGCQNSDQVIVNVNPMPIVNAGADQTVCEGVQVTLTATGASSYSWDNSVTNGVAFTPSVGSQVYTVIGTNASGCQNSDDVNVIVNPLPSVSAGSDQTVCNGTAVTLTGTGASSYSWNNSVVNGSSFTPSIGTVTYTVIGTDANGCINTDQVDVTVNPNPAPSINGANDYCAGTFATLSTSAPFTTYAWSTGVSTPTSNVTIADNPISVTVTNAFGCTGTSPNFTVAENSVINYNSSVEICSGQSATIHGVVQTTAGVYSQTYMLPSGCDSTSNVTLIVHPLPNVNGGVDVTVCTGQQVTLNATGAPTLIWNNGITNNVAFTPPAGLTVYTVTGTDTYGCQNTDDVNVTVNPLPSVDAGADQTICVGNSVTLSGSGASTYSWNNGVTNGAAFTPAVGIVTYTVTGTDANGCQSTDQVMVTVNSLPVVGAGPDQTVCFGTSVTLTGTGANTYSWDNGVTNNVAFTPAVGSVTYTVTGTNTNGCQNTDQVIVTVNPLPTVNAGVDQTVCVGSSVTLTATGASSYVWNNGVSNGVAFTPSVGSVTYTVTGTSASGCINTDQVVVNVNPLPNVGAGPDQTVCVGSQVTLTGTGASTYAWNNGVTNGVAFTPAVGTTTYTVTGTNANGCINTDQVVVTVNPLPTVFAGNDFLVCAGSSIVLTGSGATTYSWSNGVTNGVQFVPSTTTTYTVTGTDANGCVNTDNVIVTIEPSPVVSFVADTTFGCAPLTVTFTNTTGGNLSNCVWTLSNGTTLNGCGSVTTTFTNGGTFDVSLTTTSSNNCVGTATYNDYIYVENVPIAAFSASNTVLSTLDTEVEFNNTSTGANSYFWNFGDGTPNSSVVHPVHIFPNDLPASYVVTLIASTTLGCADTAYLSFRVNEELIFYVPNTFTPDKDDFNDSFSPVFTSGFDPFDYSLFIFNRWGEIIFESHDASFGWNGKYGIDGQDVQDGVYTWKIEFKTTTNDERKVALGHVNLLR